MCYSVEQFKVMINHNDLSDIQLFAMCILNIWMSLHAPQSQTVKNVRDILFTKANYFYGWFVPRELL